MATFLAVPVPLPGTWAIQSYQVQQWAIIGTPCVQVPALATATPAVQNWCAVAKGWLLSQFVGKARIEALLCVFMQQVDVLEQVLADLEQLRSIDNAYGAQLDVLGVILGLARAPWEDDADYRTALIAWAAATIANGRPNEVIDVAQTYLGASGTVSLLEDYPLTARVDVAEQVLSYDQGHRAAQITRQAIPVCVDFALRYAPFGYPIVTWDDDTVHPPVPLAEAGIPNSGGVFIEADPGGDRV
jgi:hypothetical protein